MPKDVRPIVIVKKVKKAAHGHHGGSWKVAYADFVTAMMAFFMVMWLIGLDDSTRRHIEQYFSHPVGYHQGSSSGDSPIATGPSPAAAGDARFKLIARSRERQRFDEAAEAIQDGFRELGDGLSALRVEVAVGDDGLRIELLESGSGETYFARGSAAPTPAAVRAMDLIGKELAPLANPLVVEGHTDAVPYGADARYTNWELSADRANVARRVLEGAGIQGFRVREVRALGASRPRNPDQPAAPENRRIAILLPFISPAPEAAVGGTDRLPPMDALDVTSPVTGATRPIS